MYLDKRDLEVIGTALQIVEYEFRGFPSSSTRRKDLIEKIDKESESLSGKPWIRCGPCIQTRHWFDLDCGIYSGPCGSNSTDLIEVSYKRSAGRRKIKEIRKVYAAKKLDPSSLTIRHAHAIMLFIEEHDLNREGNYVNIGDCGPEWEIVDRSQCIGAHSPGGTAYVATIDFKWTREGGYHTSRINEYPFEVPKPWKPKEFSHEEHLAMLNKISEEEAAKEKAEKEKVEEENQEFLANFHAAINDGAE
jgi:hypothetical protein